MQHFVLVLLLTAATILPGDGVPEGWNASGEPSVFEGGALFEHINGGADRYHELGFVELVVQSYVSGDDEIQLEVYDMGSPDGASTIFAEVMDGVDIGTEFGEASTHDAYQIAFHRGKYYVSVLAFSDGAGVAEAMAALAKSIDSNIREM